MATPAQIAANRVNAQHSTGPRSVEGKAATRFNALKHGADAASLIIPGEDPELFAQLSADYVAELRPQGPEESALVDIIVQADWNLRRFSRIETQLLAALVDAQEPSSHALGAAFLADAAGANALQKIFRRIQAAHRDWYKARAELKRLQDQRTPASAADAHRPEPPAPASRPIPGQKWVGSEPKEWRL